MMNVLKYCLAAFRFLTILPLPGSLGADADALKGALRYFPIVGVILGVLSAAAAWVIWVFLPPLVAAVVIIFLLLSFSGALHLDGLADCADGFFSSRNREKILVIMRDSRVGVMGVIAVVMVLLLKVSILSGMNRSQAASAVFLAPLAGRTALVIMIFLLPYVRKEGGLGAPFYTDRPGWTLIPALILFLGACLVIQGFFGLIGGMAVIVFVFLFSRFCKKKIGGATGDTLGAACELAEASMLFFALVLQ